MEKNKITFEEMFDALTQGLDDINAPIRVYSDGNGKHLLVTYYEPESTEQETYVCDDVKEVILGHICPWLIRRKQVAKDEEIHLTKDDVSDLFDGLDEERDAFLNAINHNDWPERENKRHIVITSKYLAQKCEDPYEAACFFAVCNMFDMVKNLSEDLSDDDAQEFRRVLSHRFVNDNFHNDFKAIAYRIFSKLGYEVENDGTEF